MSGEDQAKRKRHKRPCYRGGWHGPRVDLKRRVYILDATHLPTAGTKLLVHCSSSPGDHRCPSKKRCRCFYATILVSRARRRRQGDDQPTIVRLEGFLEEAVVLTTGDSREEASFILPRDTFVTGELFVQDESVPKGWFAPRSS